jgi:hypothetical protein
VIEDGERQLLDVVLTGAPPSRFAGRLHGRQEQADERADDGDHNEQFDEREGPTFRRLEIVRMHASLGPSVRAH